MSALVPSETGGAFGGLYSGIGLGPAELKVLLVTMPNAEGAATYRCRSCGYRKSIRRQGHSDFDARPRRCAILVTNAWSPVGAETVSRSVARSENRAHQPLRHVVRRLIGRG